MKIGITGGKGGTGKSTIATALLRNLTKTNKKVLLVDADVDCPNDHLLLNLERKKIRSVTKKVPVFDLEKCDLCGKCQEFCKENAIIVGKKPIVFENECNGCGGCSIVCPKDAINWKNVEIGTISKGLEIEPIEGSKEEFKKNFSFLSGELKEGEASSETIVRELLKDAEKMEYDIAIIDTAAGTHCPVSVALSVCDKVICVTEPTPLGAHDLKLILKLCEKMKLIAEIIINKSTIGDKKLIEDLALEFNVKIIKEIPFSREIINGYSQGKNYNLDLTGLIE